MRNYLRTTLLVGAVAALLAASAALPAQSAPHAKAALSTGRFDLAVGYSAASSNAVGGSTFWMQGADIQAHDRVYRNFGAVADLSIAHEGSIQSSGVGLDMVTATFGPRYTWSPTHARVDLFGQFLVGAAWGRNSVFPDRGGFVTSAHSLAVKLGGGVNIALTPRIALRAIEADWLRTQFPNSGSNVQNNCQLSTGIVFLF